MSWLATWAIAAAILLFAAALIIERPVAWRKVAAATALALLWPLLIPLALIAACGIAYELLQEMRA